ncbi:MAG: hypothetical protein AB1586_19025 [Pseudomonadota bacterium]
MTVRDNVQQRRQQDMRWQMAQAAVLFVAGVALSGISLFRIASEGAQVAELSAPAGPPSSAPVHADKIAPLPSAK